MAASGLHERLLDPEPGQERSDERRPAGEQKTFRPYDPQQLLLLAPVLQQWLPEGDLAHFIDDLVETTLDLASIYAAYEQERGFPPYDPRLMLKLLLYGYASGIGSSRKLEAATYRDVAARMLESAYASGQQAMPQIRAEAQLAKDRAALEAKRVASEAEQRADQPRGGAHTA